MGDPMLTSPGTFDPLAVVSDWLDACRRGELDALVNLYDERPTLECDCEHVRLTGRKCVLGSEARKQGCTGVLPQRHGPNSRRGTGGLPRSRR